MLLFIRVIVSRQCFCNFDGFCIRHWLINLLSVQILGPGSGWQPISLTEIITANAVKKAYRKATLYVHPDKLQQRGASIQQKYICEKVFDLLKVRYFSCISTSRVKKEKKADLICHSACYAGIFAVFPLSLFDVCL